MTAETAQPEGATLAADVRRAGYCIRPIRLRGKVDAVDVKTGEMRPVLNTSSQSSGVLLVACRNRRATVCPACSNTYRGDAWQLIAAGLRGGKGVPEVVAGHPRVFVTLTAPSFGAVHSSREHAGRVRRCRPARGGECPHGRPRRCRNRHRSSDPILGQPLCHDCFDYAGAVLWNAHAGTLWNRTVIGIHRALAHVAGMSVRELPAHARVSFIKVAEYQARGVVHLHAVIRLDGPNDDAWSPPPGLDVGVLAAAVRQAAPLALVPFAVRDEADARAVWGRQFDVRPLAAADAYERVDAVAGYIAKYATKSTDALGALDHRIRSLSEIDHLAVNPHLRRLVACCWHLGADRRYASLRLRAWAHTLGYRGHWTTKSRRYSTTFAALRAARTEHNAAGATTELHGHHVLAGRWRYAGRGYGSWSG
jgi:hypothetical protein